MPNPICPNCSSTNLAKNGKTAAGSQRYRCKDCGARFTPSPKKPGPAPTGRKSQAEIQRAYRERNGLTGNEARDRRNKKSTKTGE